MIRDREDFIPPVGFAREPAVEIRRWIGRFLLAIVIGLLGYIVINNVISPEDTQRPTPAGSELPAPI